MSDVKVQLTEDATPSQMAIAKASATVQVTDRRGRLITLKKPGVLAQFRLIEALGDTAKNETYLAWAMPIIFVVDIDGEPVFPAVRKSEVEAILQRLEDEGLAAVMEGAKEHFGSSDPESDKANIKK